MIAPMLQMGTGRGCQLTFQVKFSSCFYGGLSQGKEAGAQSPPPQLLTWPYRLHQDDPVPTDGEAKAMLVFLDNDATLDQTLEEEKEENRRPRLIMLFLHQVQARARLLRSRGTERLPRGTDLIWRSSEKQPRATREPLTAAALLPASPPGEKRAHLLFRWSRMADGGGQGSAVLEPSRPGKTGCSTCRERERRKEATERRSKARASGLQQASNCQLSAHQMFWAGGSCSPHLAGHGCNRPLLTHCIYLG